MGVPFLDQAALWKHLAQTPDDLHAHRLGQLLESCGVEFHEPEKYGLNFAKRPKVMIRGIGGMPIANRDGMPWVGGLNIQDALDALRDTIGFMGMDSYLNPRDTSPAEMATKLFAQHGVPSCAHGVQISFFVAGLSCKAELELNCQRDILHLSRLTSARTIAQDDPPILVEHAEMLPLYAEMKSLIARHYDKDLPREVMNSAFPLAKCSILGISGSLKSLWKLCALRDDPGKEGEVRLICDDIIRALVILFPEVQMSVNPD